MDEQRLEEIVHGALERSWDEVAPSDIIADAIREALASQEEELRSLREQVTACGKFADPEYRDAYINEASRDVLDAHVAKQQAQDACERLALEVRSLREERDALHTLAETRQTLLNEMTERREQDRQQKASAEAAMRLSQGSRRLSADRLDRLSERVNRAFGDLSLVKFALARHPDHVAPANGQWTCTCEICHPFRLAYETLDIAVRKSVLGESDAGSVDTHPVTTREGTG